MISADDLKGYLTAATADGSLLVELEEGAVAYLERATGRYFGREREATEIVQGAGTAKLFLNGPVSQETAASIVVKEAEYPGADQDVLVDTEDDGYLLRGNALVRRGGHLWWYGYEYEVQYTQGYKEGAEPADVRSAVLQLIQAMYAERRNASAEGLKQSETIGNYSYTNAAASAAATLQAAGIMSVQGVVNTWRRIPV